jgi:hypothetical protein
MAFKSWFAARTADLVSGTCFIRVDGAIERRLPASVEDSLWGKNDRFKIDVEYNDFDYGCRLTYRGAELDTWHFELFVIRQGHIQTLLACELDCKGEPFCQGGFNCVNVGGLVALETKDISDYLENVFEEMDTEDGDGDTLKLFPFDVFERRAARRVLGAESAPILPSVPTSSPKRARKKH